VTEIQKAAICIHGNERIELRKTVNTAKHFLVGRKPGHALPKLLGGFYAIGFKALDKALLHQFDGLKGSLCLVGKHQRQSLKLLPAVIQGVTAQLGDQQSSADGKQHTKAEGHEERRTVREAGGPSAVSTRQDIVGHGAYR
jgi:hypothetical protein